MSNPRYEWIIGTEPVPTIVFESGVFYWEGNVPGRPGAPVDWDALEAAGYVRTLPDVVEVPRDLLVRIEKRLQEQVNRVRPGGTLDGVGLLNEVTRALNGQGDLNT